MRNDLNNVLTTFSYSLKKFRKLRTLSQEELALKCNLDRTYISGLERGKRNPTLKNLYLIASSLDISLSDLLNNVSNQESQ
jgi:transcriptional regulator with XRE-family HTH domain